jgi:NADH-quinone oxidoreductase subunit D
VRIDEMRQRAANHDAGARRHAEGLRQATRRKFVLPEREKMKTQMEALIYHFKIVTEGFRVPPARFISASNRPRGEIGYYVVSDGTTKPYVSTCARRASET